jgi:hypothetical protein
VFGLRQKVWPGRASAATCDRPCQCETLPMQVLPKTVCSKVPSSFQIGLTAGTFSIATMRAVRRHGCNLPFRRSRRDGRVIGARSSSLVVLAGFRAIDVNKLANRVPSAVLLGNLRGNHLLQIFPKVPHPRCPSRSRCAPSSPSFPLPPQTRLLERAALSSTPSIGTFSSPLCNR